MLLGIESELDVKQVVRSLSIAFGTPKAAVESWLSALPWVLASECTLEEAERLVDSLSRAGATCRARESVSAGQRRRSPSGSTVVARVRLSSRPLLSGDEEHGEGECGAPISEVSIIPVSLSATPRRRTSDLASAELEVISLGNTPSQLLHLKDARREPEESPNTYASDSIPVWTPRGRARSIPAAQSSASSAASKSSPGWQSSASSPEGSCHQDEYTPRPVHLDSAMMDKLLASAQLPNSIGSIGRPRSELPSGAELFATSGLFADSGLFGCSRGGGARYESEFGSGPSSPAHRGAHSSIPVRFRSQSALPPRTPSEERARREAIRVMKLVEAASGGCRRDPSASPGQLGSSETAESGERSRQRSSLLSAEISSESESLDESDLLHSALLAHQRSLPKSVATEPSAVPQRAAGGSAFAPRSAGSRLHAIGFIALSLLLALAVVGSALLVASTP